MLKTLQLVNFRNHIQSTFEWGTLTVVVGENARGKTNIMEALYLMAMGESFRAKKIEEMVHWEAEAGHAIARVDEDTLQVTVTRGMVMGARTQKRLFKINGLPKRRQDFVGALSLVLFRPEDMELVVGEPLLRRKFLDEVLVQIDREYRWSLESYQKGLKQRNRLLDQIREKVTTPATLYFWDQLLMREGEVIQRKRQQLVDEFNTTGIGLKRFHLDYQPSVLTPATLKRHLEAEIVLGYTLAGPHKDDVILFEDERDLAIYGSRGEQRMAVLWLKNAQLYVMEKARGERPVLLLDDILSELDHHHVTEVVGMCHHQQTIITTTDEAIRDYFGNEVTVIRLR